MSEELKAKFEAEKHRQIKAAELVANTAYNKGLFGALWHKPLLYLALRRSTQQE